MANTFTLIGQGLQYPYMRWDAFHRPNLFRLAVDAYEEVYRHRDSQNTEALRNHQETQLRRLITFAYARVPFYRQRWNEHGIASFTIVSRDDLSKLPILERRDVAENSSLLIAEGIPSWRILWASTNGSTGEPLMCGRDRLSLAAARARYFQVWRWAGLDPYVLSVLIASPRQQTITPGTIIYIHPTRIHLDYERYIDGIRRFRPTIVRGASLGILEFARFVSERGYSDVSFQAAILYGQAFTEKMRAFIEQTFGCRVYSLYALKEASAVGAECPFQTGLHVFEDDFVVEVVDGNGQPVQTGEVGQVVLTDLTNYCMPLIRYNTGDLGFVVDRQCACGRRLLLIQIDGRREDLLHLPNGKLVTGAAARHRMYQFGQAVQLFQVIQHAEDRFEMKVVRGSSYTEGTEREIRKELALLFGASAKVSLMYCERIPLEPSGKIRQIVSLSWRNRFPQDFFAYPSMHNSTP